MAHTVPVREGGRHADKCLAAARHGRARETIELAARAADLAQTGALGRDLPVEIGRDAAVDRHHVVELRDDLRRIDIRQRCGDDAGVVVHPVVEPLRADRDAEHPLIAVQCAAAVREHARLVQLEICVRAELGVHTEVVQTGAREELAEHGRHTADAELNGRPVADVRQEQVCDRGVLRARRVLGRIEKRCVRTLDDHVHIGNVNDLVKTAAQPRQMLVDLQNNDVRLLKDRAGHAGRRREVEVSVAIHRRDARHGDVHREKLPVIPREVAEDHRREVAQAAVA